MARKGKTPQVIVNRSYQDFCTRTFYGSEPRDLDPNRKAIKIVLGKDHIIAPKRTLNQKDKDDLRNQLC